MTTYIEETHDLAHELGQIAHRADPTPDEELIRTQEMADRLQKLVDHFQKGRDDGDDKTVEEEIQDMIRLAMAAGKPKKSRCDQDKVQRFSTISTYLSVAAGKAGKP
jgi:hypothetical protein